MQLPYTTADDATKTQKPTSLFSSIGYIFHQIKTKSNDWRFGIKLCTTATFTVYILNLIATIWMSTQARTSNPVLYEGSCATTAKLSAGIHLVINALSTIVLASSNYCMQCLSAPTRDDVDKAHKKGRVLDVGVLSGWNLVSGGWVKFGLWGLLGVSSVGLSLFYNSVVFTSVTGNTYFAVPVTETFFDSGGIHYFASRRNGTEFDTGIPKGMGEAIRLRQLWSDDKLEKLDNLACMNAYSTGFQAKGSVLLVLNTTAAGNDVSAEFEKFGQGPLTNGSWVWNGTTPCPGCSDVDTCPDMRDTENDVFRDSSGDIKIISYSKMLKSAKKLACRQRHASTWSISAATIEYCLSEQIPQQCRLQSSIHIAITVIVLNSVKALVMLVLATCIRDRPLLTIGDALASFLDRPDPYTKWMCLGWRKDFEATGLHRPWNVPNKFKPLRRRLFSVASRSQAAVLLALYFIVFWGIVQGLLFSTTAIEKIGGNTKTMMKLGMGKASTWTTFDSVSAKTGVNGLMSNSFIANIGQLVFSLMYISYNRIFTIFSGALEWESYAENCKGLRVSGTPLGEQKSTHFLTLPYRIAVPLMALSGILHWLVSQAIFLVVVEYRHYDAESGRWTKDASVTESTVFRCGFSPLAIIVLAVILGLMFIAVLVSGAIRLKTTMPVAGNCSAAIAAACHVSEQEETQDISVLKLQWGVTGYRDDGIGHCAFSKLEVTAPEEGLLYE